MLGGKPWDQWIDEYGESHQHPVNRLCHTLGIPMIALSLPLAVAAFFVGGLWPVPLALFRARVDLPVCRARGRGEAA